MISFNGRTDWTHFNLPTIPECEYGAFYVAGALGYSNYAGIGHFAGNAGADVLIWNGPPMTLLPDSLPLLTMGSASQWVELFLRLTLGRPGGNIGAVRICAEVDWPHPDAWRLDEVNE